VKPVVHTLAEEVHYEWVELHLNIAFSRLRETDSGAVRGMVEVSNGTGKSIWWAQVSLTTATDRKTLTQKLDKASPRPDGWELDVDRVFQDVYQRHVQVPAPVDLADVQLESEEARFMFDPVLPDGQVTLLLADQGSTKSYLMLYLCACIVLGVPSVFGPPVRQGPVVYFDWEVDSNVARRRLAWICRGLGVEVPRGLHYVNMSERGRLMDRIRDMRFLVGKIRPELAVVDSLTFATGGDLNSAEYAAPTMSAIGSLGDGLTKLVSAHPSKGTRNANVDEVSVIGSGLFEFRARAIWFMKREEKRTSRFGVTMLPRKPFDGRPATQLAYRMVFDNNEHATRFEPMHLSEVPELANGTMTQPDQIRMLLRRHKRLDTVALAELAGLSQATVKTLCNTAPDIFPAALGGGRGKPTVWALGDPNVDPPPWWTGDKP
jgi:hypothetical protein